MKNLEQKLEIMQWLFNKGIEPEMGCIETMALNGMPSKFCFYYIEQLAEGWLPWYPLEQVLELLPTVLIDLEDHADRDKVVKVPYFLLITKQVISYTGCLRHGGTYSCPEKKVAMDISYPYKNFLDQPENLLAEPLNNYHLSALKLLKQVYEQYPEEVE